MGGEERLSPNPIGAVHAAQMSSRRPSGSSFVRGLHRPGKSCTAESLGLLPSAQNTEKKKLQLSFVSWLLCSHFSSQLEKKLLKLFCLFVCLFISGGKTQVMGEIKVALKKEVKTEGDQLVLEILQCRNITYKFKSPDHLPGVCAWAQQRVFAWTLKHVCVTNPSFINRPSDLYVKLYVVNVATQKRIIKKKTRVCRHDREPSFNETFRFPLNPTGHSIQVQLAASHREDRQNLFHQHQFVMNLK